MTDFTSESMAHFYKLGRSGAITQEQFDAFCKDPNAIFEVKWRELFLRKIPADIGAFGFQVIDDVVLYEGTRADRELVVYGEHSSHEFDEVSEVATAVDGKSLFVAEVGSNVFTVWGDWHKSTQAVNLEDIRCLSVAGGKFLHIVEDNGVDKSTIVWGGEIIAAHHHVDFLSYIGGKLLYASKDKDHEWTIVWGEKKFPVGRFNDMCHLEIVDGKPMCCGDLFDRGGSSIVWGDEVIAHHDHISRFMLAGGLPMYVADNESEYMVVHGADKYRTHARIWDLRWSGGKPLYCASSTEERNRFKTTADPSFIVHGTTTHTTNYTEIDDPCCVGDTVVFRAQVNKNTQKFVVVVGNEESKQYDEIFELRVDGNTVIFHARKGRKLYRVTRTVSQ